MMRFDLGDSLFGRQEEDWEKQGDIRSCHEMGPVALAKPAYESVETVLMGYQTHISERAQLAQVRG